MDSIRAGMLERRPLSDVSSAPISVVNAFMIRLPTNGFAMALPLSDERKCASP